MAEIRIKPLVGLAAAFLASAAVGTLFAACDQDCEEIMCRESDSPNEGFLCTRYEQVHAANVWMRDPPGGQRNSTSFQVRRFECPDCNPECPNPQKPSEATNCSPLPDDCSPGQDCCEYEATIVRYLCDMSP